MKKIGYIVSKRKIKETMDFVGVVKDLEEIDDPTKPFLVIGYNEAKSLVENFDILNKQLDEGVFWTFSKTEKRNDHERDINNFYNYIINNIYNNIKYYYINILNIKYNKFKKLYNILLYSSNKNYIYFSKNMIYVFYDNKNIIGLSLDIINYIGLSSDKILNKLKTNKNNIIYTNDSFLSYKIKKLIINKKYLIPYFMYLNIEN